LKILGFDDMVFSIYYKGNASEVFIDYVFAKSFEHAFYLGQIFSFDSCPEFDDEEEIGLMNESFGQFFRKFKLGVDVIVQIINRAQLHIDMKLFMVILLILHL
jgi:hypothetical protein